jgi:hypothetical protein
MCLSTTKTNAPNLRRVKQGTVDGFLSGEIENIVFTPTKIRQFLSASPRSAMRIEVGFYMIRGFEMADNERYLPVCGHTRLSRKWIGGTTLMYFNLTPMNLNCRVPIALCDQQ